MICHNAEQAERDAPCRTDLVAHLQPLTRARTARPAGAVTSWSAASRQARAARYLRRTTAGQLRIDHAAIRQERHLDGKWLLRTSDTTLTPDDLAAAYKQLLAVNAAGAT